MSNALAIAAVTLTLRKLLADELGIQIQQVTARALDGARKDMAGDQINLFLYHTLPDAAWRNMDMPRQVKAGETALPPLPLVLYYLLTAYTDDEDDTNRHALLGRAMSSLHDHCLLDADEIKNATSGNLPDSNLDQQLERVRLTLQPLTLEELSKLWTTFQTQYRFSVAYQVSVVLIESTRATRTPLPVLTRGQDDRGVQTVLGAAPLLEEVRVPLSGTFKPTDDIRGVRTLPSAQLGDEVALLGQNLLGDSMSVRFKHPFVETPLAPEKILKSSDTALIVKLPAPGDPTDPTSPTANWPAGFYTVQVITSRSGEPDRVSNELAFLLAPTLTLSPLTAAAGNIALSVSCAPLLWPGQRVSLLFRDGEIVAPPRTAKTQTLNFNLTAVPSGKPGEYVLRLRVDGVDSIAIDRTAATPKFADNQKLKVT